MPNSAFIGRLVRSGKLADVVLSDHEARQVSLVYSNALAKIISDAHEAPIIALGYEDGEVFLRVSLYPTDEEEDGAFVWEFALSEMLAEKEHDWPEEDFGGLIATLRGIVATHTKGNADAKV